MTAGAVSPGRNPLIVALDTGDLDRLERLAAAVAPVAGLVKVGLQGFTAHGPAAVRTAARHAPVFADLKLHDIPNTVAGAAAAAADLGIAMLTVHAGGGPRMVAAAAKAAPDVMILAVTVLTSVDDETLRAMSLPSGADQVPRLARMAAEAGAGGIVCAASEIRAVRGAVGPDLRIVVPGIRPPGTAPDDQARVATPAEVVRAGADYLVVGRPITNADDPAASARAMLAEATTR